MTELHRNDVGVYTVTMFDELGRKVGHATELTYTAALDVSKSWISVDPARSTVAHRCVHNSKISKEGTP